MFLLFATVALLAYANGANDNFKGVATLFGSGTTSYRRALWLAMIATLAGSLTAIAVGQALIQAFSGKGLVGPDVLADPSFLLAVSAGAGITVLIATVTGFPISTTHALVGALLGASLLVPGGANHSLLVNGLVLPLLLTPAAALAITYILYAILRRARLALGISRETCLCIGEEIHTVATETPALTVSHSKDGEILLRSHDGRTELTPRLSLTVDTSTQCIQRYRGRVVGISAQTLLDALHFASAGAVSFARGLQDTAKIVGLLVGAGIVGITVSQELFMGVALVGVAMALGGLFSARRVANTMSQKITDMNHGQGFTANLVTSAMVIGTALQGMPVSTTHCSVGSVLGVGLANRTGRWHVIGQILLSWIITLPVAAVLGLGLYVLIA